MMHHGSHRLRIVVLHRGCPPPATPDPWSAGEGSRIVQLARAIATSTGWRDRAAAFVVRESPEPLIAAIGHFGDADEQWMIAASRQLTTTLQRLILLDDAAAMTAVTTLATKLDDRFGAADLKSFRYAAVPRGGLIVLGMLAYVLDLPHDRLQGTPDTAEDDVPLVIVDDIAISGLRLSQTIAARSERRFLVATLHAHPDLRSAFLAAQPRVAAFVAAHDLRDHAPGALGEHYDGWRQRWRERATPSTVWIGQGDHVVYPWNEPDLGVWNTVTEREEPGWRVVPPERCLKSRATPAIEVQRMHPARGHLRPHPDVISGELDGQIVIGHLGTNQSFALDGVAADIWRSIDGADDAHAVARRVASTHGVDASAVASDVESFMAELLETELLVQVST